MDILRMLLIAEATGIIFEYGIKPEEQDFREFTADQYLAIEKTKNHVKKGQKLYSWIPPKHAYHSKVVLTATEEHKRLLLEAASNIELHVENRGLSFATYKDKLKFAASIFPPEISDDTPFAVRREQVKAKAAHLSPAESPKFKVNLRVAGKNSEAEDTDRDSNPPTPPPLPLEVFNSEMK